MNMETHAAILGPATIFKDARWRRYPRNRHVSPHGLYVAGADGTKSAALILRRTRADGDWALSQSALTYLADALREGRIVQGFVVMAERWNVVAHATVREVVASIGDTEPRDGDWGLYFWLDTAFKPVTRLVDETKPF
jgi:hypothetical protein